jgi:lysophospholipase L1-like esterase
MALRFPFTARLSLEQLEDRCLLSAAGPQVVFLGDSINGGFARSTAWSSQMAPLGAVDQAISGSTTQDVLKQVEGGALNGLSPRVVVLMVGTNDIYHGASPTATAEGVAAVVSAVRTALPQAHLLLEGILPRAESPLDPLRTPIAQANLLISRLGDGVAVRYADFGAAFLQPDGTISPAMLTDYLHPSAQGYQLMAAVVSQEVRNLITEPVPNVFSSAAEVTVRFELVAATPTVETPVASASAAPLAVASNTVQLVAILGTAVNEQTARLLSMAPSDTHATAVPAPTTLATVGTDSTRSAGVAPATGFNAAYFGSGNTEQDDAEDWTGPEPMDAPSTQPASAERVI